MARIRYIEGGVADDRVVDTVQLYMLGLMDINTAIGRLAQHQPNNQICLLNQSLTDECLHYIAANSSTTKLARKEANHEQHP